MNIIIVGAGKVGSAVAEILSNKNDVMVIEEDTQVAEKIKSQFNVSIFNESGTNPKVLEEAIVRHQADIIISTVSKDADNLFICMMSKQIKPEITTISRIRDPDYMVFDKYPIVDKVFSPELLSAKILSSLALLENAVDYESFESIGMSLATFLVTRDNSPVIGKVPIGLQCPEGSQIIAVLRGDSLILDCETIEIRMADQLFVLGTNDGIGRFNQMMGVKRTASDFIILGATVLGIQTARLLESKKRYVKLIDPDSALCRKLARQFSTVKIINGNTVDPHLLRMENVSRADVVLALDDNDETNLLASLMSRNVGTTKIISEYSLLEYEEMKTQTAELSAATPWTRFDQVMGHVAFKPVGEDAFSNQGRFKNDEANKVMAKIPTITSQEELTQAYRELNKIFMQTIPVLPVMYRPTQYYQFSTKHWTNFPTEENPYAPPQHLIVAAGVKALWEIKPVK